MQIITLQDAVRERFNLESRTVKNAADYMRIYLKLLQTAFEYNLIVKEQRDGIANIILQAVNALAKNNPFLTSNYVYVLSMRLLEVTNFEAWCMLEKIDSYDAAYQFVAESKDYFEKRVERAFTKVIECNKLALNLRNSHLLDQTQICKDYLKEIYPCFEEDTKIELKKLHTQEISRITYLPMHYFSGTTYLERIESIINALFIEMSILDKLDAEKLLREMGKRRRKPIGYVIDNNELKVLRNQMAHAKQKVAELTSQYQEKIKEIDASDKAFEKALEKFEKENAHLSEEEREDLFDEYWMNCPEYVPEDRFEVQEEYEAAVRRLEDQIHKYQMKIDIFENNQGSVANILFDNFLGITLHDVLGEYAVFVLANTGQIDVVMGQEELAMIKMKLPNELIVQIFLKEKADEIGLTQEEKNYLKC